MRTFAATVPLPPGALTLGARLDCDMVDEADGSHTRFVSYVRAMGARRPVAIALFVPVGMPGMAMPPGTGAMLSIATAGGLGQCTTQQMTTLEPPRTEPIDLNVFAGESIPDVVSPPLRITADDLRRGFDRTFTLQSDAFLGCVMHARGTLHLRYAGER
jgi:hypothetical protein